MSDIIDTIDNAIADYALSPDAMRWTSDEATARELAEDWDVWDEDEDFGDTVPTVPFVNIGCLIEDGMPVRRVPANRRERRAARRAAGAPVRPRGQRGFNSPDGRVVFDETHLWDDEIRRREESARRLWLNGIVVQSPHVDIQATGSGR